MEKKNFKSLLIIFLLILGLSIINPIQITDESVRNEISKDSMISELNQPQSPSISAWTANGIPICIEKDSQHIIDICSDGEGGAIIVWADNRTGTSNQSIYAQRISSNGDILWDPEGVLVSVTNSFYVPAQICAAKGGGVIIGWNDYRNGNGDIYAQKLDIDGNFKWNPKGLGVCTDDSDAYGPEIISDELGGAIFTWMDERNGHWEMFGLRINSDGDPVWFPYLDGKVICTYPYQPMISGLCIDGWGGAIIAWLNITNFNSSIYASRVGSDGSFPWASEVTISNGTNYMFSSTKICSDGDKGAIIIWESNRSGIVEIYAQRINTSGDILWSDDGLAVCASSGAQDLEAICSDGDGGVIISWEDERDDPSGNLYVQRLNSTGDPQWDNDGLELSDAIGHQEDSRIATDGNGGAYIIWEEEANSDIYAQYINSSGSPQWDINGIPICDEDGYQGNIEIVSDGSGGAIIVWNDKVGVGPFMFPEYDIYALKININGIFITPKTVPRYPVGDDDDDDDDNDEEIEFLGPTLIIIGFASAIGIVGVAIYLIRKRGKIRE